ncbi:MAG: type II toxin-antitoxin system VapC family toxin [Terracidiphilus sp.]
MIIYADTSFQISAYIVDLHSSTAVNRLAERPRIYMTPFSRSEVANAIYRQAFIGRLSRDESSKAWQSFESDCAVGVWETLAFPDGAWETCAGLARQYAPTLGVRTLDSLHVACALELKAERFWTFDERQARLAEAVGLDTRA